MLFRYVSFSLSLKNFSSTLCSFFLIVNLEGCGVGPLELTSSDPAFTVKMDGTIQAVLLTMVSVDGRSFWITVQDRKGHSWFVDVYLSLTGQVMQNIAQYAD